MSTELSPQELNAFVDGELDLQRQLEIEARAREDAALRARVDALRRLREAVRTGADYHAAPAALRARIAGLAGMPAPVHRPARSRVHAELRRWFAWRPLASSLVAAVALALGLNHMQRQAGQDERLAEELVASHVRATLTQRAVDVASSDHHTVKPWLSSRLDFSPPLPEPVPGSTLLGGRVDYLGGRPVAVLAYRHGAHLVDHYEWPTADADSPVEVSMRRGFRIARWSGDGMAHRVISDLNAQEFAALVRPLERADGAR